MNYDFLPVAEVASRWGISVNDVLHQADMDRLVLSVRLIGKNVRINRHREDGYSGTVMPEIPMLFEIPLWTARRIAVTGCAIADELTCRGGMVRVEVLDPLNLTVADLLITRNEIARIEAEDLIGISEAKTSAAENTIGWHDATLSAAMWFGLLSLAPREAAMLLCRFNPHDEKSDPMECSTDKTTPSDFKLLLRVFEDVDKAESQPHSLKQWLGIARDKGLKYHSWIDEYVNAAMLGQIDGEQNASFGAPANETGPGTLGEPPLRSGVNRRTDYQLWVAWQANQIVITGDIRETLAERIRNLAIQKGYFSEQLEHLAVASFVKMIPAGTTGTRATNGRKKSTK